MRVSLYTQIFPRLEVFFLEEWIEHNSNIGIDSIYIYNNGYTSVDDGSYIEILKRKLTKNEQNVKWIKKPDSDYFLEYTDDEIDKKLNDIAGKYENVYIKNWRTSIECPNSQRRECQIEGYKDCVNSNKSDWWIHLDPDEFLCLHLHDNIKDFIGSHDKVGSFNFTQRVFENRKRNQKITDIIKYGYDLKRYKSLVKFPINEFRVHSSKSSFGKVLNVDGDVARFHHYRGTPSESAGKTHIKYGNNNFNKMDRSLQK